jgi:hypothetical protein
MPSSQEDLNKPFNFVPNPKPQCQTVTNPTGPTLHMSLPIINSLNLNKLHRNLHESSHCLYAVQVLILSTCVMDEK